MIAALLVLSALGAEEPECVERPELALGDALQAADIAWHQLDGDRLDEAMTRVRRHIACLEQPVDLDTAVTIHRAHARHTWTVYDPQASARAWLAVRRLVPEWTPELDADVPKDHPVREIWDRPAEWTQSLPEEPPGGWRVDGVPGSELPRDRAFVLQGLDRRGDVAYSAWHLTAAEVPQTPWRAVRVRRIRHRGTVVAGALLAGGLGMLGGAAATRTKIRHPDTPDSQLLALRRQADILSVSGLATAGTSAVTLGVLWGVKW